MRIIILSREHFDFPIELSGIVHTALLGAVSISRFLCHPFSSVTAHALGAQRYARGVFEAIFQAQALFLHFFSPLLCASGA